MELLQLKYFCDAAQTENFSLTARKHNVPASCISQSIHRLEKELNTKLFIRQANKIVLNESGKQFYESVYKALTLIENVSKELTDEKDKGEINICINTNRRIVMQAIEKFKITYPEIHIKTMLFCNPLSEDFDLIIETKDINSDRFSKEKLLSEEIGVAVNKNSPFATGSFYFGDLKNEPFITMSEKSNLYSLTHNICNDFGFLPKLAVQSDDPYYVRKCVELELGVAVVPLFSWQGQYSDDIVLRTIKGYKRDTFVYYSKNKYMSLCTKNFIELLKEECK